MQAWAWSVVSWDECPSWGLTEISAVRGEVGAFLFGACLFGWHNEETRESESERRGKDRIVLRSKPS